MLRYFGFFGSFALFLFFACIVLALQNLSPMVFYAGVAEQQVPGIYFILALFGMGVLAGLSLFVQINRLEKDADSPDTDQ